MTRRITFPLPALALFALAAMLLAAISPPRAEAAKRCAHAGGSPREIAKREARRAVVCLINKERRRAGLDAYDKRDGLRRAANKHTDYMKFHSCFAHQCPGEPPLEERVRRTGYPDGARNWGAGENIGWASGGEMATPRGMVDAWMASSGHRAAILDRTFEHIGVGVEWGTPSDPRANGGIYTADFGWRNG